MISLLLRALVLGLGLVAASAHGQTQTAAAADRAAALKTSVGVLSRAGSSLAKDLIHGRMDGGVGEGGGDAAALHTAAAGSWAAGTGAALTFNIGHSDDGYTVGSWGGGGVIDLSGKATAGGADLRYDGRLNALHLGADRRHRPHRLAGLSLGHTAGDLDNAGQDLDLETQLTGVHPYYARWLSPNLYLWTAAGLSRGTAKVTETTTAMNMSATRRASSSLRSTMAGGGVSGRMQWTDAVDIGLRASLVYSKGRLDRAAFGDGAAPLPKTEATTLRLDSEWEVGRHIATGRGAVRPFFTAGFRQDYRDAGGDVAWNLGSGAEFSGGDGLVIRVQGKNQVSTTNTDHRENSLSAEVRWAWNFGRLGLAPYTTLNMNDAERDWIGGVRMALPGAGLRLGFEAGVDAGGADYGTLFSGEWRF